jgi:hypothetical protein
MVHITLTAMLGLVPLMQPVDAKPTADPASLLPPAEVDARARELVKTLGDEHFHTREEAHRDLRDLGRFALPAIRDGMEGSAVPEVVRRCELLYPRAFALDTRARVDCFAADTDGKFKHDLPGADAFFAITGRTDAARQLYRDLILSPVNRDLIATLGQSDEAAASAAAERRTALNPRANGFSSGKVGQATALDVVGLLFVETALPDLGSGVGINSSTYLLTSSQLRTALSSDPRKEALAAVTVKWFETRTDPRSISACMTAAASLNLNVALPMAKKMLTLEGVAPAQKAQAACKVAQLGTADDLALLAPLLHDEGVAFNGVMIVNGQRQNNAIQVRDVALAMSLLMAKKDPLEHGMKTRYPGNTADSLKYNYYNFHFEEVEGEGKMEEVRADAVGKWYEYAEKNLKNYPKAPAPKAKADAPKKDAPKADPPKMK